jgi:hypothetical protein
MEHVWIATSKITLRILNRMCVMGQKLALKKVAQSV